MFSAPSFQQWISLRKSTGWIARQSRSFAIDSDRSRANSKNERGAAVSIKVFYTHNPRSLVLSLARVNCGASRIRIWIAGCDDDDKSPIFIQRSSPIQLSCMLAPSSLAQKLNLCHFRSECLCYWERLLLANPRNTLHPQISHGDRANASNDSTLMSELPRSSDSQYSILTEGSVWNVVQSEIADNSFKWE